MNAGKIGTLGAISLFLVSSTFISALLYALMGGQSSSTVNDMCPQLVEAALAAAANQCQGTGPNQLCSVHPSVQVQSLGHTTSSQLDEVGSMVDVRTFHQVSLSPMDAQSHSGGLAIMRLQQSTLLAFGDMDITNGFPAMIEDNETANKEGAYDQPLQAFYLRTGESANCQGTPRSGLLIRNSADADEDLFMINGVNVRPGLTVFLQAQTPGNMTVSTLEGATTLEAYGVVQVASAGTQIRVPLGDDLIAAGPPEAPEPFDAALLQGLPLQFLDRLAPQPSQVPTAVPQPTVASQPTEVAVIPTIPPPAGVGSTLTVIGRWLSMEAAQRLLPEVNNLAGRLLQAFMSQLTPATPVTSVLPDLGIVSTPTQAFAPTSRPSLSSSPIAPAQNSPTSAPPAPTNSSSTAAPTNPPLPTKVPTNPPPTEIPTNPPATVAPTNPPSTSIPTDLPPTDVPTNPLPTDVPTNPPPPTDPPPAPTEVPDADPLAVPTEVNP